MTSFARSLSRPIKDASCSICAHVRAAGTKPAARPARYASTSSGSSRPQSGSTPPPPPRSAPQQSSRRAFSLPLAVLLVLPAAYYFYPSSSRSKLSPMTYSDQKVESSKALTQQHKLLGVHVRPSDLPLFGAKAVRLDGSPVDGEGEVVVQHVMIKSPDLQIERPYTPINDVEADGKMDMVVKRVRGGEVGRLIHSLKPGDDVGIRGPITTFSINPSEYDRIVMISSGTGVAPMLQLLNKLPSTPSGGPAFHLVQSLPQPGRPDWLASTGITDSLQQKLGDRLHVERIPAGQIDSSALRSTMSSVKPFERLMVLVCLPPNLMKPLCGPLTVTLQQGELTGTLREMGLNSSQVYKLE